jgi:hypothetical protein
MHFERKYDRLFHCDKRQSIKAVEDRDMGMLVRQGTARLISLIGAPTAYSGNGIQNLEGVSHYEIELRTGLSWLFVHVIVHFTYYNNGGIDYGRITMSGQHRRLLAMSYEKQEGEPLAIGEFSLVEEQA